MAKNKMTISKFQICVDHNTEFDEIEVRNKIEELLDAAIARANEKDFEASMMDLKVVTIL